jgi:hypothetical protein
VVGRSFAVRAVDGTFVHLESTALPDDLSRNWGGNASYVPQYGGRATTSDMWALELAPLSALEACVESLGGRQRQRFAFAGGEIVVYDSPRHKDARWAAWLGPWHMAHGMFYEPSWETADIVGTFSRVRWVDTPEGLTADAEPRFKLNKIVYLLAVPDVGMLKMQPRRLADDVVPRWRGYTAPAGEIWRMPAAPSGGAEPLLFATSSAVATLFPRASAPGGSPDSGSVVNALSFLHTVDLLEWSR